MENKAQEEKMKTMKQAIAHVLVAFGVLGVWTGSAIGSGWDNERAVNTGAFTAPYALKNRDAAQAQAQACRRGLMTNFSAFQYRK